MNLHVFDNRKLTTGLFYTIARSIVPTLLSTPFSVSTVANELGFEPVLAKLSLCSAWCINLATCALYNSSSSLISSCLRRSLNRHLQQTRPGTALLQRLKQQQAYLQRQSQKCFLNSYRDGKRCNFIVFELTRSTSART